MKWWKRLIASRSENKPIDVNVFGDRPYTVFSNEYDIEVEAGEVYDVISPDSRYPRDSFFEEYERSASLWYSENSARLTNMRQTIVGQLQRAADPATSITVLIDHSGSLLGEKQIISHIVANEMDRALLEAGVEYEVLGYTTRHWRGGESRISWSMNGSPRTPGRLCDLLHIKYRTWDDRTPTGNRYNLLLDPQVLKENVDGEAVEWAQSRFEQSRRSKHLLIMVSDGAPVDDSTLHENYDSILVDHLISKIDEYEASTNRQIIGFGVGYEVYEYFYKSVSLADINEIPETIEALVSLAASEMIKLKV